MQHILVCDDEKDIVAALKIYLESDGYCVHTAYSGEEALRVAKTEPVQLALMDIMMPGMDGITAMAKLREFSNIPVILLTAKSEDSDKILGLSVGADDYITKPFNPVEVLARVKSQLRRFLQLGAAVKAPSELTVGGIALDHDAKRVTLDGEEIALTPKEYDIYSRQNPRIQTRFWASAWAQTIISQSPLTPWRCWRESNRSCEGSCSWARRSKPRRS